MREKPRNPEHGCTSVICIDTRIRLKVLMDLLVLHGFPITKLDIPRATLLHIRQVNRGALSTGDFETERCKIYVRGTQGAIEKILSESETFRDCVWRVMGTVANVEEENGSE